MPPGAVSGGQQGTQKAAASVTLRQPGRPGRIGGLGSRVELPLWCMPNGAGRRNPIVRAEMRLSVCQVCGGTSAVTVAMWLGMPVMCVRYGGCSESWDAQ